MNLDKQQLIYIGVGLAALALIGGGGYYATHGGSPLANQVVLRNKHCQDLLKKQNKDYDDCQKGLDKLVADLIKNNEMLPLKCSPHPTDQNAAICPVLIGSFNKKVVVKLPDVVTRVKNRTGQGQAPPAKADKYPKRRRRSFDRVKVEEKA